MATTGATEGEEPPRRTAADRGAVRAAGVEDGGAMAERQRGGRGGCGEEQQEEEEMEEEADRWAKTEAARVDVCHRAVVRLDAWPTRLCETAKGANGTVRLSFNLAIPIF